MKMASLRQWLTLLIMVVVCAAVAYGQGQGAAAGSPSTLTGMKILPYNRGSDSFADDIADSQEERLNEIDLSFLVKVEVSGKAGEYAGRNVVVTVHEGKKLILTRDTMVGIFNENGKYYVPVWIYGPLCQPTTIEAKIVGQKEPSTIKKTLKFQCGE